MRSSHETQYREYRDALARDWYAFMHSFLPEALWMPLPSLGEDTPEFMEEWGINGLILTGGQAIGDDPVRDESEFLMLDWAVARNIPVLGVCRGLQVLQTRQKGGLVRIEGHVGMRHDVELLTAFPAPPGLVTVNSYHTYAIPEESLADGLTPLAGDETGMIEAAQLDGAPVAGVMWHPERESTPAAHDLILVRRLFCAGPDAAQDDCPPGRKETEDRG